MRGSQPFARARMMFAAIAAAMSAGAGGVVNLVARREELAAIGNYESRGKGRGGYQRSRHRVAMDKRAAIKARNRRRG